MKDRELDALVAEKVMGWTPHPTLASDDKSSVGGPWWRLPETREENLRLKTKIKILENNMSKQEKAMEEFVTKFQVSQGSIS